MFVEGFSALCTKSKTNAHLFVFFTRFFIGYRADTIFPDLSWSLYLLKLAAFVISDIVSRRGKVLFVDGFSDFFLVSFFAKISKQYAIDERWISGILTNFRFFYPTVFLRRGSGFWFDDFHSFNGVRLMHRVPNFIVLTSSKNNALVAIEAFRLGLPTIALFNGFFLNPSFVTYPIFANSSNFVTVFFFLSFVKSIILNGYIREVSVFHRIFIKSFFEIKKYLFDFFHRFFFSKYFSRLKIEIFSFFSDNFFLLKELLIYFPQLGFFSDYYYFFFGATKFGFCNFLDIFRSLFAFSFSRFEIFLSFFNSRVFSLFKFYFRFFFLRSKFLHCQRLFNYFFFLLFSFLQKMKFFLFLFLNAAAPYYLPEFIEEYSYDFKIGHEDLLYDLGYTKFLKNFHVSRRKSLKKLTLKFNSFISLGYSYKVPLKKYKLLIRFFKYKYLRSFASFKNKRVNFRKNQFFFFFFFKSFIAKISSIFHLVIRNKREIFRALCRMKRKYKSENSKVGVFFRYALKNKKNTVKRNKVEDWLFKFFVAKNKLLKLGFASFYSIFFSKRRLAKNFISYRSWFIKTFVSFFSRKLKSLNKRNFCFLWKSKMFQSFFFLFFFFVFKWLKQNKRYRKFSSRSLYTYRAFFYSSMPFKFFIFSYLFKTKKTFNFFLRLFHFFFGNNSYNNITKIKLRKISFVSSYETLRLVKSKIRRQFAFDNDFFLFANRNFFRRFFKKITYVYYSNMFELSTDDEKTLMRNSSFGNFFLYKFAFRPKGFFFEWPKYMKQIINDFNFGIMHVLPKVILKNRKRFYFF